MSVRLLRGLERVEALARNGMDPFYAAARIARLAGLDAGALAVLYQQKVSGCEVRLSSERAETDPKVFTRIHMHFVVRGKDLKPSMIESAIKLSHTKYCSASIMLGKTAQISHDFEIVPD